MSTKFPEMSVSEFLERLVGDQPFYCTINATLARHLVLHNNLRNRSTSQRKVREYAQTIAKGEWEDNGSALVFSIKKTLIDGGHRLHAIVRAEQDTKGEMNVGLPTLIVPGKQEEVVRSIDVGSHRTAASHLELMRFEHPVRLASAVAHLSHYLSGAGFKGANITPTVCETVLAANPTIKDDLDRMVEITEGSDFFYKKAPLLAAMRYILKGRTPYAATVFDQVINATVNEDFESEDDPVATALNLFNDWTEKNPQPRIDANGSAGILLSGTLHKLKGTKYRKPKLTKNSSPITFKAPELTRLIDLIVDTAQGVEAAIPMAEAAE